MLTDTGQTLVKKSDIDVRKIYNNVALQAGARTPADAWSGSPRGGGGGGQVATHLPLRPHQLLLQQPRPAPAEPGVHR